MSTDKQACEVHVHVHVHTYIYAYMYVHVLYTTVCALSMHMYIYWCFFIDMADIIAIDNTKYLYTAVTIGQMLVMPFQTQLHIVNLTTEMELTHGSATAKGLLHVYT